MEYVSPTIGDLASPSDPGIIAGPVLIAVAAVFVLAAAVYDGVVLANYATAADVVYYAAVATETVAITD